MCVRVRMSPAYFPPHTPSLTLTLTRRSLSHSHSKRTNRSSRGTVVPSLWAKSEIKLVLPSLQEMAVKRAWFKGKQATLWVHVGDINQHECNTMQCMSGRMCDCVGEPEARCCLRRGCFLEGWCALQHHSAAHDLGLRQVLVPQLSCWRSCWC